MKKIVLKFSRVVSFLIFMSICSKNLIARLYRYNNDRINSMIRHDKFSNKVVISDKHTGLGARFCDILNGMLLAKMIGSNFLFAWPSNNIVEDLHGIKSVESIFDESFIKNHLIESYRPEDYETVNRQGLHLYHFFSLRTKKGLRVNGSKPESICDSNLSIETDETIKSLFYQIKFNRRLELIRNQVNDVVPSFDYGIHVRRGDVYNSCLRYNGKYIHKTIPFPLIVYVIEKKLIKHEVLIICEDKILVKRIKNDYNFLNVKSVDDYDVLFSAEKDATAFSEMCALAKCKNIIGSKTSNYVQFASMINDSKIISIEDILEKKEIYNIMWEYINQENELEIAPLEVAGTCQYIFQKQYDQLDSKEKKVLLKRAYTADPDNPVYVLKIAADAFRDYDDKSAIDILKDSISTNVPEIIYSLCFESVIAKKSEITRALFDGNGILRKYDLNILENNIYKADVLYYYLGLKHLSNGSYDKAKDYLLASKDSLRYYKWYIDAYNLANNMVLTKKL